jgi:hypothetical protein
MVKRSFQLVTRDYAKRWGSMPQLPRPEYDIGQQHKRYPLKMRAS